MRARSSGMVPVIAAAVVIAAIVAGGIVWWRRSVAEHEAFVQAENARHAREQEERGQRALADLATESGPLMPEPIRGVTLGMTIEQVKRARVSIRQSVSGGGEPGKVFYEERLPNGAGVVYGFERRTSRLSHVQVMSLLDTTEGIGPHLRAMNDTYGTPTGAYDCADTGGVPTRRFTWRRTMTGIADIFLVYGDRISVTLYIGPNDLIAASLQRAQCKPVSRAMLGEFPRATAEQLQQAHP